jgi:hypothetical protein
VRIPIWPGVRLSVWEKQDPDAVKVVTPFVTPHQPIRRVLSKRGWMLLLVRYDWRDKRNQLERLDTPENGAWFTVWLESGKWRWTTQKMTTEQREYAADRVAAYSQHLAHCDGELGRGEPEGLRWWREVSR